MGGGLGRSGNAGSFNYTAPANTLNDENIVVIGDLEETDPTAEAAQRQLAGFARRHRPHHHPTRPARLNQALRQDSAEQLHIEESTRTPTPWWCQRWAAHCPDVLPTAETLAKAGAAASWTQSRDNHPAASQSSAMYLDLASLAALSESY
ncbi:MAG: hypothetical protein M3332_10375 [Actinomycetota bacterium]|nr:hypothetical protein [Actinomycetota bacterium]